LVLYPNPVYDVLTIDGIDAMNTSYSIYDMHGQQRLKGYLRSSTIDVSDLTVGMYLIEIQSANRNAVLKFLKH